uniref:Gelsolin-like domain-containing protein n=1 Tax=Ciona savignyi TaxID=51511 RepID=H2YUU6_CIOSA
NMSSDKTLVELEKAGKSPGLQIWRIENMHLAPVAKASFGTFFTGDSYILLNTIELKGSSKRWDLHFWLGDESSQDERGAAAILATQMDDKLNGVPVQYREVQGHESSIFSGYFKGGITYKKGGVASGFNHARTNVSDVKRLLHLKGKRMVRMTEVEMTWKSFNQGDIFIVEVENDLFQWNGSVSNRYERLKGCEIINNIKNNEKAGKGKITVLDEGDKYPASMLKALAGSPKDIRPEVVDEDVSQKPIKRKAATLYHVSSDTGTLEMKEIGAAPFKQDSLLSGDCFIVDNGAKHSIFVWKGIINIHYSMKCLAKIKYIFLTHIGKAASKDERVGALKNAEEFIKTKKYKPFTKIQVMAEGAESALFTQFFKDWKRKDHVEGFGKAYSVNKIAIVDKTKFDVKELYKTPKLAAKHGMVDNGSGKVQVWRIEGNDKVAINKEEYGRFYTGDCYIILYTYTPRSREEYIIYFWQGAQATKDEEKSAQICMDMQLPQLEINLNITLCHQWGSFHGKVELLIAANLKIYIGGSAILTTKLDDQYGGRPVQVRVVEGKEPPHLLSIFGNPLVISKGGYDKTAKKEIGLSETALYQVRSTSAGGTKAIEVTNSASSLNSNDAFVVKTKNECFVWIGRGASDAEVAAARAICKHSVAEQKEGSESSQFWSVLGGKKEYASSPRMLEDLDSNPPRLFAISNAKGRVTIEEVPGEFTQGDLEPDDVMMLDAWDVVFIWIGEGANAEERSVAPGYLRALSNYFKQQFSAFRIKTISQIYTLVKEYIDTDPRGRDSNCPVHTVKMNMEPVNFVGFFPSWDHEFFNRRDSYAARMKKLA